MSGGSRALVSVQSLEKRFLVRGAGLGHRREYVHAVDGVDLDIAEGETLGLVGESGCGKTTLGRILAWLHAPDAGTVTFLGKDLSQLGRREGRAVRKEVQIVFQDPASSLNPRMRISEIIGDGLEIYKMGSPRERAQRVEELLSWVGLDAEMAKRYPHQCSGGQRQRVAIARALAVEPRFIVADEAVSALDVSVQAQVLNLLLDLKASLGLTYLFIGHNVGVVAYISDRIAVMYLGKIVEVVDKKDFLTQPLHPYTVALLSAVPGKFTRGLSTRVVLPGDPASPTSPPSGCRFRTRCPIAKEVCEAVEPPLKEETPGHLVACHFPGWKPGGEGLR